MAITTNENLISNLSYTEKDFQVIYPALLELVKKETLKWDPSASNEADPGVLLLKLNAIIADKCNYNIDKNVLECFPVSVTQERNARQLFEQLGYYMHWYTSAKTTLVIKYTGNAITDDSGDETIVTYQLPKFSMVTNDENSIVYTVIEEKCFSTDGVPQTVEAIQGIIQDFEIAGETTINTTHLDSNNRLYLPTNVVAENGIFISNNGSVNYSEWKKKDNLLVEEVKPNNKFYKFGVSQDLASCYLEFPTNAEELFQDGINIKYVITLGAAGNIAPYVLEKAYNSIEFKGISSSGVVNEQSIDLNDTSVSIKNYTVGAGGSDPESNTDAYIGYKHTVGTFNTLITLRDYLNAVIKSDYVSNAVVCDRTNDIQSSYDIVSDIGSVEQTVNEVALKAPVTISTLESNNTVAKDSSNNIIEPDIYTNYYYNGNSYRAIIKNGTAEFIQADEIPTPSMTAFDLKMYVLQVSDSVTTAAEFNTTFNLNLDETLLSIIESEIAENKCVQHDFIDVEPNKPVFFKNKYCIDLKVIPQILLTTAQRQEISNNIYQALYSNLNSAKLDFGEEISYDNLYDIIKGADKRIKAISLDPISYTTYAVVTEKSGSSMTTKEYDISNWSVSNGDFTTNSKENSIRTDIYAKSVLAGKTDFFVKDDTFDYNIRQEHKNVYTDVAKITSNLRIPLAEASDWTYVLKDNEIVEFMAPNLIEYEDYSSNVKIDWTINHTVAANTSYMLKDNEYVGFFWTNSSSASKEYTYAVYGKGTIIKNNFELSPNESSIINKGSGVIVRPTDTITTNNQTYVKVSGSSLVTNGLSEKIRGLTDDIHILSGTKSSSILLKNSLELNSAAQYCCWIKNEKVNNTSELFSWSAESSDSSAIGNKRVIDSYTLQSGEYFIYTDQYKSDMEILGAGTKLTLYCTSNYAYSAGKLACELIDYTAIVSSGLSAVVDKWQQIGIDYVLEVTEMQYTALSEGTVLKLLPDNNAPFIGDDTTNIVEYNVSYYKYNTVSNNSSLVSGRLTDVDSHSVAVSNTNATVLELIASKVGDSDSSKMYLVKLSGNVLVSADDALVPSVSAGTVSSFIGSASPKYGYGTASDGNDIVILGTTSSDGYGVRINRLKYYFTETEISNYNSSVYTADGTTYRSYQGTISVTKPVNYEVVGIDLSSAMDESRTLDNITIKYKASLADTDWQSLPDIRLDDSSYAWQAVALLRLNLDNEVPQVLYENQSMTLSFVSEDASDVNLSYDAAASKNTYILSSSPILNSSRTTVTKQEEDTGVISNGEPVYETHGISMYTYTLDSLSDSLYTTTDTNSKKYATIDFVADGSVSFSMPFTNATAENVEHIANKELKLPVGYYILPVEYIIPAELIIDDLTIKVGNSTLPLISDCQVTAANNKSCLTPKDETLAYTKKAVKLSGKHYMLYKQESTSAVTLSITVKAHRVGTVTSSTLVITIPSVYKFELPYGLLDEKTGALISDDTLPKDNKLVKAIFERMLALDYNGKFNYMHNVDADHEITDPLDALAFLNQDHVMNQYTICQLDTANTSVYVSTGSSGR